MANEPIRILLIEDNPGDVRLLRESLAGARGASFTVEQADRLEQGVARLRRPGIDAVLLDLSLPDSQGFDTIVRLQQQAPHVAIVALSGLDDERLIQDAVKQGADDYLVKGGFTTELLVRTIRYAIDRKQARDILAQARDSALESARLRAEFLANMSHEIRTPLNGLIGMTRLLMDTRLTADQRDMIDIARVSADTLLRIVNDILDFSKISAGKVSLEEVPFDLATAVESVVQIFAEQALGKEVALDSFIDGDVPVLLRGDPGRLCQVLTNLVGNAVKFTSRGEIAVRVACMSKNADGVVLRFQVRDTGIGIPLESQRHIFQAFAQANGSTTRKFGGTGLGLAIGAQLVELMGGNIGLQSEPGGGSTFWFTAAFGMQPASAQRTSTAGSRLSGVRILVADHSAISARLLCDHLSAWGMRPATAAGAAQTLVALKTARAANDPFELVLLDMQLPEMDGLTLARAIKSDPVLASTRLLGMYSLGGRPHETQMKAAGIRAQLAKPIKQSQLFNALVLAMAGAGQEGAAAAQPPRRLTLREIPSRILPETRAQVRILLAEDNLVNQQVAQRTIERIGYSVECVTNGRLALEALARTPYNIVLMDCQMPEMDGYTATAEIRRREGAARHTTIIGITAHALTGDREECLRVGMDDYLAKPVTPEDMRAMLDKWVEAGNTSVASHRRQDGSAAGESDATGQQSAAAVEVLDGAVLAGLRECQKPGEPDFLSQLIGVFLADLSIRIEEIRAAFAAGDAERISVAAHALKGSSGELGARRLREVCARLEAAAAGSLERARPLLRDLEAEADNTRAALDAERVGVSA